MVTKSTIEKLEARYLVRIVENRLYDTFDIYTRDNCHWACVAGYRSLVSELAQGREAFKRIK